MTEHAANGVSSVKGKDIRGKLVTLELKKPAQLSLFQTFLAPDEDKYSNTIELYDAIPKYYPRKHMDSLRINAIPFFERSPAILNIGVRLSQ